MSKSLSFSDPEDARDYLRENGYRPFAGQTYQARYSHKTARWNEDSSGQVTLTVI
jgi:hypothetical protein